MSFSFFTWRLYIFIHNRSKPCPSHRRLFCFPDRGFSRRAELSGPRDLWVSATCSCLFSCSFSVQKTFPESLEDPDAVATSAQLHPATAQASSVLCITAGMILKNKNQIMLLPPLRLPKASIAFAKIQTCFATHRAPAHFSDLISWTFPPCSWCFSHTGLLSSPEHSSPVHPLIHWLLLLLVVLGRSCLRYWSCG